MQQAKREFCFQYLLNKYGAYGLSGVFLKNREDNDFDWRKIIW